MKKLLLFITIISIGGCVSKPSKREPIIERMCQDAADDILTQEEIAYWDSMNATEGGYLLIRGAERKLDTIVNHLHLKFITDK